MTETNFVINSFTNNTLCSISHEVNCAGTKCGLMQYDRSFDWFYKMFAGNTMRLVPAPPHHRYIIVRTSNSEDAP